MNSNNSRKKMFKYSFLLSFLLSVFQKETYASCQEVRFLRNMSYVNMKPYIPAAKLLRIVLGVSKAECGLQCLRKPLCAGFWYFRGEYFSYCELFANGLHKKVTYNTETKGGEFWTLKDVCPREWVPYDGHCYFLNETVDTWSNAKNLCETYGAHLVEIETDEENFWIQYNFLDVWNYAGCPESKIDCCYCWIGATDRHTEGVFTWNFHTNVTFDDFNELYSENIFSKDCVLLCKTLRWDVANCDKKHVFICEKDID